MSLEPGMGRRVRATPPGRERRATLVALATIAAGPLAWMVQLWSLALASDIPCRALDGPGPLGLGVETWWLAISGAAALVALAGLIVAMRMRAAHRGAPRGKAATGLGTVPFLSMLGAWSSALFLATIALGATAPLFLDCP